MPAAKVARPLDRRRQRRTEHRGRGVHEQDGGERHVAALEGHQRLLGSLLEHAELAALEVVHRPAVARDGDVELLELELDRLVDADGPERELGVGAIAVGADGDDPQPPRHVLLSGVDGEPPGRPLDAADAPAVEPELDARRHAPAHLRAHPHRAEGGGAGRRLEDPHLELARRSGDRSRRCREEGEQGERERRDGRASLHRPLLAGGAARARASPSSSSNAARSTSLRASISEASGGSA